MTDPYREYARVYDQHIGERDEPAVVQRLIRRQRSSAASVLEFACGTGAILAQLSTHYDICGVDISEPMLAVARAKLEHGTFVQGDMCRLRLEQRFDIVLCVFNSINHLRRFSDWKLLFRNAHRHLNPGGLFIFDINTETAFKNYAEAGHMIEEYDRDIMASSFSIGPRNTMHIDCRIFKHVAAKQYHLIDTRIVERTYPVEKIRAELKRVFAWVNMHDPDAARASKDSEVLYFICGV